MFSQLVFLLLIPPHQAEIWCYKLFLFWDPYVWYFYARFVINTYMHSNSPSILDHTAVMMVEWNIGGMILDWGN
jgi:hypothetical protein